MANNMGGMAHDLRGLRVYPEAFSAAMEICERSRPWPAEEGYVLADQVRRSSRAACAGISGEPPSEYEV